MRNGDIFEQSRTLTGKSMPTRTKTHEDAARTFHAQGVTISEWATRHGFCVSLVYQVLAGKRKCLRGQSHRIAVALKLKPGADAAQTEEDGMK